MSIKLWYLAAAKAVKLKTESRCCAVVPVHPSGSMQDINPEIKGLGGYQPDMPQKREWPELVGTDATEAKDSLEKETGLTVLLVKAGSMVTMDFRTNRVRIWYDPASNKVVKAPKVG